MRQRWAMPLLAFFLLAGPLAGCIDKVPTSGKLREVPSEFPVTIRVLNASSNNPIFLARVTVLADDEPVLAVATDANGTAPLTVPEGATGFAVDAAGFAAYRANFSGPGRLIVVRLVPLSEAANALPGTGLAFRPAIDLGSRKYVVAVGTSCLDDAQKDHDADCGLGEPQVEVDSKGTIYVSGVCCIGNAPPVYVSRDDGKTFKELLTPTGIREKFGIEGDFAIDGRGTVYFADIEFAATFQVTAWDKDGAFLRHMKWPAPPIVDRDWIRAEGDGKLYYVYNTGSSTNVFTSKDGGMTWDVRPAFSAPYGLGNAVKGLKPGEVWLLGGNNAGKRRADFTMDGGATWKTEPTTSPTGGMPTGAFDDAGNLFAAGVQQDRILVAGRAPDGAWLQPTMVSPDVGHHRMPWVAAGGPGKVAVAWYGTLEEKSNAKWYVFVAASLDADAVAPHWQVAIADPEPVLVGSLGRELLDFLQVEIGPDGAIHVAYSKLRANEQNGEEQLHYVHSEPTLPLAASNYLNGPH